MHVLLRNILSPAVSICCAVSAAQACQTAKQLPDGETVTPFACAIDARIAPLVEDLLLVSKETLDTRLVSVEVGERNGAPVVTQVFEHWLYSDQVDAMQGRGGMADVGFIANRARFESDLPGAICATFDAKSLQFFRTGGVLRVVVTLRATDKVRNADTSIEVADITLYGCGES